MRQDAIRICRIARELEIGDLVKVEVLSEQKTLLPDPIETLKAAELLVRDGFTVLPYINADPVLAKRLQEVGTATVMPRFRGRCHRSSSPIHACVRGTKRSAATSSI